MKHLEKLEIVNGELGKDISEAEVQAYVDRGRALHPNIKLIGITIVLDGENADLSYEYDKKPFERIRRITGYLVGTLDRFNDAKRHEVEDRVKHGLPQGSDLNCEDCFIDADEEESLKSAT